MLWRRVVVRLMPVRDMRGRVSGHRITVAALTPFAELAGGQQHQKHHDPKDDCSFQRHLPRWWTGPTMQERP
jgi:hypothetical protein